VFIGAVIIRDVQRSATPGQSAADRGARLVSLSDGGFGGAIQAAADRAPLPVEVGQLPAEGFPRHVELAAYFVVSEALTNVAKHACASEASVTATMNHGRLTIAVRENGAGGAVRNLGGGLQGLRDRLAAIEGRLEIKSHPRHGTTIRASMPCL
jgi:signal transduction histidine kinase